MNHGTQAFRCFRMSYSFHRDVPEFKHSWKGGETMHILMSTLVAFLNNWNYRMRFRLNLEQFIQTLWTV